MTRRMQVSLCWYVASFSYQNPKTAQLEQIERTARLHPETVMVHKFEDRDYNRMSKLCWPWLRQLMKPYILNHTSVHTLGLALLIKLPSIPWFGLPWMKLLGLLRPLHLILVADASASISSCCSTPNRKRSLGHHQARAWLPNSMGTQWAGWTMSEILSEKPDEGSEHMSPTKVVIMIGACWWVALYNVPVMCNDVSIVRWIARMASGHSSGLPTVQALALVHVEYSVEVACVLLVT